MPTFDPEQKRLVARVVFDGPPNAGKTTNLRELCRFFSTERRGDVYTPAEADGRTLYFDWLQLECGFVGGRPLRCHLVSVPGQDAFALRRSTLLREADAIVFVCESTPNEVAKARRGFDALRTYLDQRGRGDVPIIVQANKQDLRGSVSAAEVREMLGAAKETPAVAARAAFGEGIRESVMLAVRAISARLQSRVASEGVETLTGPTATPDAVYRELLDAESNVAISRNEPVAPDALPSRTDPPNASRRSSVSSVDVRLPDADLPPGCVWPSPIGREVLSTLTEPVPVQRRTASPAGREADPTDSRVREFDARDMRLKTSARLRFDTLDEGRAALREHVQRRLLLGSWLAEDGILALQRGPDTRWWLWSIAPRRSSLRATLVRNSRRDEEASLARLLACFADAAVNVYMLAQWHRFGVDLHPSNFAWTATDELKYVDDFLSDASPDGDLGEALLQRVDEYSQWPAAIETYSVAIERAAAQARGRGFDAAVIAQTLENAPAYTPVARAVRDRLTRALSPRSDSMVLL